MAAKSKKEKTNKLGNLALIFAFACPIIGIVLGVIAIVVGSGGDKVLLGDGIKAVILSVVAAAVIVALVFTILAVAGALPFVLPSVIGRVYAL